MREKHFIRLPIFVNDEASAHVREKVIAANAKILKIRGIRTRAACAKEESAAVEKISFSAERVPPCLGT